jgi:hypothetical protein
MANDKTEETTLLQLVALNDRYEQPGVLTPAMAIMIVR